MIAKLLSPGYVTANEKKKETVRKTNNVSIIIIVQQEM